MTLWTEDSADFASCRLPLRITVCVHVREEMKTFGDAGITERNDLMACMRWYHVYKEPKSMEICWLENFQVYIFACRSQCGGCSEAWKGRLDEESDLFRSAFLPNGLWRYPSYVYVLRAEQVRPLAFLTYVLPHKQFSVLQNETSSLFRHFFGCPIQIFNVHRDVLTRVTSNCRELGKPLIYVRALYDLYQRAILQNTLGCMENTFLFSATPHLSNVSFGVRETVRMQWLLETANLSACDVDSFLFVHFLSVTDGPSIEYGSPRVCISSEIGKPALLSRLETVLGSQYIHTYPLKGKERVPSHILETSPRAIELIWVPDLWRLSDRWRSWTEEEQPIVLSVNHSEFSRLEAARLCGQELCASQTTSSSERMLRLVDYYKWEQKAAERYAIMQRAYAAIPTSCHLAVHLYNALGERLIRTCASSSSVSFSAANLRIFASLASNIALVDALHTHAHHPDLKNIECFNYVQMRHAVYALGIAPHVIMDPWERAVRLAMQAEFVARGSEMFHATLEAGTGGYAAFPLKTAAAAAGFSTLRLQSGRRGAHMPLTSSSSASQITKQLLRHFASCLQERMMDITRSSESCVIERVPSKDIILIELERWLHATLKVHNQWEADQPWPTVSREQLRQNLLPLARILDDSVYIIHIEWILPDMMSVPLKEELVRHLRCLLPTLREVPFGLTSYVKRDKLEITTPPSLVLNWKNKLKNKITTLSESKAKSSHLDRIYLYPHNSSPRIRLSPYSTFFGNPLYSPSKKKPFFSF